MSVRGAPLLFLLIALRLLPSPAAATLVDTTNFTETPFVFVATDITGIAWAPDGSNRLFVTRKGGQVRVVKDSALLGFHNGSRTPSIPYGFTAGAAGNRGFVVGC